jgi:D-alanyl-D-alanine carboxypeptidase
MVRRQRLLGGDDWSYWLHRHRRVDRFQPRAGLGAADQPRASNPPSRHRHRRVAPPGRRSDRRRGLVTGFQWRRWAVCIVLLLDASTAGGAASIDDLVRAYPDALAGFDGTNLIWRDGTRMPVGDGRPDKSFAEQLRNGSILDQLRLPYPVNAPLLPAPRDDPGRVRNRAFFDKMYGDCKSGQVAPALVSVTWLPKTWGHAVRITSVNGADRQLAAVSRELDELPAADKRYLYPLGGTYACRSVADTEQRSMHAWGAAIDINPAFSDYWRWHRSAGAVPAYVNRIPLEVVAVFERHGFIWGGRWAHFDTMHFEYRPELLTSSQSERRP